MPLRDVHPVEHAIEAASTLTGTDVLIKTAATQSSRLWGDWESRDGELVVVTCLQRPGQVGNTVENVIIYAERTSEA